MKLLQYTIDHWQQISAGILAVHAAATHLYIAVWHAGGYRTIWRNFQGPKTISPDVPADKNETKT